MRTHYVSLDSYIVVEDENEDMTEQQVIDNAASQITTQLMYDIKAFEWLVETEEEANAV